VTLKIEKRGSTYLAESGSDRSTGKPVALGPTDYDALFDALLAKGYSSIEVMEAFIDADPSLATTATSLSNKRLAATGRQLKISRDGSLLRACLNDSTRSDPAWETPYAMSSLDLYDALRAQGLHPVDVQKALREYDPNLLERLHKRRDR